MPTGAKMISYLMIENLKTLPYPATHTYIAHIWEYSPPPPPGGTKSESFKMLSAERLVRSARFWSCFSLSLLIVRAKSTGMEVNRDFTSKETMTSSLVMECCFICCVKMDLFWTVKVFFLRGDRSEARYLGTAYVGLPILFVIGRNGLPGL